MTAFLFSNTSLKGTEFFTLWCRRVLRVLLTATFLPRHSICRCTYYSYSTSWRIRKFHYLNSSVL